MLNIANMIDDQYYTIEEIAKILKVAYLTVYRWIQDDKLKAIKAGKQYRIKQYDLNNFTSYKKQNEISKK